MVDMFLELEEAILKDKKIKDSDLKPGKQSPCYSVKSLWGIPKQFQRALTNLNRFN